MVNFMQDKDMVQAFWKKKIKYLKRNMKMETLLINNKV